MRQVVDMIASLLGNDPSLTRAPSSDQQRNQETIGDVLSEVRQWFFGKKRMTTAKNFNRVTPSGSLHCG
jgi:hypothetical protein